MNKFIKIIQLAIVSICACSYYEWKTEIANQPSHIIQIELERYGANLLRVYYIPKDVESRVGEIKELCNASIINLEATLSLTLRDSSKPILYFKNKNDTTVWHLPTANRKDTAVLTDINYKFTSHYSGLREDGKDAKFAYCMANLYLQNESKHINTDDISSISYNIIGKIKGNDNTIININQSGNIMPIKTDY